MEGIEGIAEIKETSINLIGEIKEMETYIATLKNDMEMSNENKLSNIKMSRSSQNKKLMHY